MGGYAQSIQRLIERLAELPGLGPKSAERIAFHLLKSSAEEALALADAIREVKTRIRPCSTCFHLTEDDPCSICTDPRRDRGLVCVVEQPKDLLAIEAAGAYGGLYHVLLGRVAPTEGIGLEQLTVGALVQRIARSRGHGEQPIREVILATNPTVEGDVTAAHILDLIKPQFPDLTVSRLARGLSAGANIENANRSILTDALAGRRAV
ncbi:MAG: recombination mediator RecR [Tepidisphaerales bacterium]